MPPSQDDVEDAYVDLGAYARKLWTNRVVILAIALASAASVALVTLKRAPTYAAETSVIVRQSKVGDRADSTSMATFLQLLESQNVANEVIQELGLKAATQRVGEDLLQRCRDSRRGPQFPRSPKASPTPDGVMLLAARCPAFE